MLLFLGVRISKSKLIRLSLITAFILIVVLHYVLQLDAVRILRARAITRLGEEKEKFINAHFKDQEKLINLGSLVRDREDTEKWDREIAEKIRLNGPIDSHGES